MCHKDVSFYNKKWFIRLINNNNNNINVEKKLHDEHQGHPKTSQMLEPILDCSIHEEYQHKSPDNLKKTLTLL